ncbi:P27 family phage terminase small subunit [Alloscardovia omnicolens]|uniref:P27 family phage terminase small subunit n=1 Tax=Alloscardovia omnicolens TaxID=419015 RepID=UPI003A7207F2
MAKDGTNRGGRRTRAGSKPTPLREKIAQGKDAKVLDVHLPEVTLLVGEDIGEGADLEGEDMPEPSAYLSAKQKDGHVLCADELYRETWAWLKERGCEALVSPRLLEAYAQNFARYIQCENAISTYGLLGKHPTTGGVVTSPFVSMSQSFQKQANLLWYEIFDIVKQNSTVSYQGQTPADDLMERLLNTKN